MNQAVRAYNANLDQTNKLICDALYTQISEALTDATHKVWHGHPVWFINDNPIVGYDKQKTGVRVLFWSGQSFEAPGLKPEGTFKAAEVRYRSIDEIDKQALKRWLVESETTQWDYKNIVKRRGQLEKLSIKSKE